MSDLSFSLASPQNLKSYFTMTHSLSSWLNNIKSDDIDGGLAADFDGSLSGLGVELGSSTYNMSEALLALPVFKQESLEAGDECENACHSDDVRATTPSGESTTFSVELMQGALVVSSENNRFQYILGAPTSPATKMNEETLTYLNQGQSYEIKLKRYGETAEYGNIKSIVRVVFHDRRLQYMELEQLQLWRLGRPGERLLDIDIPLSSGITDVKVESNKLNSVSFRWDQNKDCSVYVKVHCISTEFTAKKHGGEKGVPFRVQVETYVEEDEDSRLVHCASCQVKVFKPKGADRKQKTDRDKMEKRSGSEKEKYQPSYEFTVLSELPLEQVQSYLEQLLQQELLQPEYKKWSDFNVKKWNISPPPPPTPAASSTSETTPSHMVNYNLGDAPYSPASSVESLEKSRPSRKFRGSTSDETPSVAVPVPTKGSKSSATASVASEVGVVQRHIVIKPRTSNTPLMFSEPCAKTEDIKPLSSTATAQQVTTWLQANRFSNYVKVFQNFSGADVLRLTRDDLIQICGLADGIRLNNAIQSKTVRPKLTIYVSQMDDSASTKSTKSSGQLNVTNSDKSPSVSPPGPVTPPPGSSPTSENSQGSMVTEHVRKKLSFVRVSTVSSPVAVPALSTKRQIQDAEPEEVEQVSSSKKQRTRALRMSQAEVYHALYLDTLTVEAMVSKIAELFSINADQLIETFVVGPSGINVFVTDSVVQNFVDQSRFYLEAEQDDDATSKYRLLMRLLD